MISNDQKVRAMFSKMREGESLNAWDMSRAVGVEPITAERLLDALVTEGTARKEGNYYFHTSPNRPAVMGDDDE